VYGGDVRDSGLAHHRQPGDGSLQDPMYETSKLETTISGDMPALRRPQHGVFYELFNEPNNLSRANRHDFLTGVEEIVEERLRSFAATIRRPARWWLDLIGRTI